MDVLAVAALLAFGFAGGLAGGLVGVCGGILFVPALVALGLTQIEAEATSLLAIVPTVAAGVWRQQRYGNVRWRAGAVVGLASIPGVVGGSFLAVSLSQETLQTVFAVLMFAVAAQIAWRSRRA